MPKRQPTNTPPAELPARWLPQLPQLLTSLVVGMQNSGTPASGLPHSDSESVQEHVPLMQSEAGATQTLPHSPQLLGSRPRVEQVPSGQMVPCPVGPQ